MLSGYFKRLLMARQLHFLEGDVGIFDVNFTLIPTNHYVYLRKILEKKYSKVGIALLYEAGKKTSVEVSTQFYKRFKAQKIESITLWQNIIELTGFAKVSSIKNKDSSISVELTSSFAKKFVENEGKKSGMNVDEFMAGYLAGIFSNVYGKEFECKEIKCIAAGNPYCEFILKAK